MNIQVFKDPMYPQCFIAKRGKRRVMIVPTVLQTSLNWLPSPQDIRKAFNDTASLKDKVVGEHETVELYFNADVNALAKMVLAAHLHINPNEVQVIDEGEPVELEATGVHYYLSRNKDDLLTGWQMKLHGFYIWLA
jgi:hypothetical protein